ncbi:MAG: hypothetical protein IJU79_07535 [Desulfovibrionaceae bacterium]|nr:hypothetical protein [Desulfovibrionaceae bacterium]
MKCKLSLKTVLLSLLGLGLLTGLYFYYMSWAFPDERNSKARHLMVQQLNGANDGDCYGCHKKVTARIAQEWYESKHGVILVRCQTCHGMADGSGSMPFTWKPGVDICAKCHSLAIKQMASKFGQTGNCVSCHPHHQSPMHGNVYEFRLPSTKTAL